MIVPDAMQALMALGRDDRANAVPDDVWEDAARHYDEPALAALILAIANVNTWNRLNVATRQVAGSYRN